MSNNSKSLVRTGFAKVVLPLNWLISSFKQLSTIIFRRGQGSMTKLLLIALCAGITYGAVYLYRDNIAVRNWGVTGETALYKLESKLLDAKIRLRGPVAPTGKVGILAADEETLIKFGEWPISRKYYGPALRNLRKHGVKVVGFDAVFPESEDTKLAEVFEQIESISRSLRANPSGQHARSAGQQLHELRPYLDQSVGDVDFAKAVSEWENVVLGYFSLKSESEVKEQLGPDDSMYFKDLDVVSISEAFPDMPANRTMDQLKSIVKIYGMKANYDGLNQAAAHFGFFDNDADQDSINRWVTVLQNYQGLGLPSLALKTAALAKGMMIVAIYNEFGLERIELINEETEEVEILTTDPYSHGRMLINHRGPGRTFEHFSLQDAYYDTFTLEELEKLKGMTLLYGGTATGTQDLRPNPFDPAIDGVENHAALVDNIIAGDYLVRKPQVFQFRIFGKEIIVLEHQLLIFLGILFAPFVIWASSVVSGAAMVTFIGGLIYYDWTVSFLSNHEWHYMALPCAQLFVMFFTCNFFRYVVEEREKRAVKGAFEHYLSPDVIKQVLDDPAAMALGGTRKDITVFFSDVRSFTTISEGLSPERLTQFMNLYFEPMTSIILESRGTLDKYIGDAIMAFWGAPIAIDDHARAAARASVTMMFALDKLRTDLPAIGLPKPDIGIGLNSGPASVGNMGSAARFSYTALGDSVNLGARLEGVTKEYNVKILMSEATANQLDRQEFFYRDMDLIKVKGKEKAVRIFELMRPDYCGTEQKLRDLIGEFEMARQAYLAQDWQRADKHLLQCLNIHPDDGPAKVYQELVDHMRHHPPGDAWDGVKTMTHK